jgi:V/A-type H+-transporting ATPase subunit B
MTTRDIVGPLLLVEQVSGVTYGELVELEFPDGTKSFGNVLEVNGDVALVQAFQGTRGSNPSQTKVRFLGRGLELGVSRDMLGRVSGPTARRRTRDHARQTCSHLRTANQSDVARLP